jgi:hypothetical protein
LKQPKKNFSKRELFCDIFLSISVENVSK